MRRLEALQLRHRVHRRKLEAEWIDELHDLVRGEDLIRVFGNDASALDVLCYLSALERALPMALRAEVREAAAQGHSWNEIAAAVGVSRQALRKRFPSA